MRAWQGAAAAAAGGMAVLAAGWLWQGRPARYGELAKVEERALGSPVSAYRLTAVSLTTTAGRRVACVLRRPAAAAPPHSLPGVLLLGGIGTGRRAATLVASDFTGLVVSCDHPFADPSGLSTAHFIARLPAIRRDVLGTPEALRVAASYLLARPEVDSARLAAVGASLGVPAVSAWASRDPRPAVVALVMGGAPLAALFDANLGRRVPSPAWRRPVARLLAALLRPLEPGATVGGIAPRPVLVLGAREDERIPRAATRALYAAAARPKTLLWVGGRHLLPTDTTLLRVVTDSTMAWVARHLEGSS